MHNQYQVPTKRLIGLVLTWAVVILGVSSWIFTHQAPLRVRPEFNLAVDGGITRYVGALDTFDAGNYYAIATHGYVQAQVGLRAFFPLFPVTMHWLMMPWRGVLQPATSFALIATLTNLVALAGGALLLWRLTELDRPGKSHYWALGFLLAFPGAFFFMAPYTESLFLLFILGAFYAARTGRWWLAGTFGLLATTTRLPGIVLMAALGVEYLEQCGWRIENIRWNLLWLGLIPLGALGYFGYLQFVAGGLSTYLAAYHASWPDRHATWNILAVVVHPFIAVLHHARPKPNDLLGLMGVAIGIAFLLSFRRFRLRYSYGALVLLGLLLPLLSGNLESLLRYVMVMFPLAILFDTLASKHPRIALLWLVGGSVANLALMYLFVRGVFVG